MKQVFVVVLFACLNLTAEAALTIHIVQGVDKPYPIAMVPFKGDTQATGVVDVVAHDLRLSGRFEAVSTERLPQRNIAPDEFEASEWLNLARSTDYAVIGQVEKTGEAYHLAIQVISLLDQKSVLGRSFKGVKPDQLRTVSHHISDLIFEAIIGVKGDFSTRIAYVEVDNPQAEDAEYQLFVADADGHNPHLLLKQHEPIATPAWSPDGRQLAYVTYTQNQMAVYAIGLKTGHRERLTYFKGINSAPAWSPDGTKMAMALSMGESEKTDIYILDLASKQLERLTSRASNTGPAWSPDGQRLAYTSTRGGLPQIYEVNFKSKLHKRVSYQGIKNFSPAFTPDGQNMVMMHQAKPGGPIRIAVLNLKHEQLRILSQGQIDKSPSVSPSGSMILYANYDKRWGVLAEVSLNGAIQLVLPSRGGSVQSPAWSPYI